MWLLYNGKIHIFSVFISFCFFLNSIVYTVSPDIINKKRHFSHDSLTPALRCSKLLGLQQKDMGRIKYFVRYGRYEDDRHKDFKFFINSAEDIQEGSCVKCRFHDEVYKTRTYYCIFDQKKSDLKTGGLTLQKIYTDKEFEELGKGKRTTPIIYETYRKSIERYYKHETGLDPILEYAHDHEKDCVGKPRPEIFDYRKIVLELIEDLELVMGDTPEGLLPIEDRDFSLINLDKIPEDKLLYNQDVTVADKDGNEYTKIAYAHSSNKYVNCLVVSWVFNALMQKKEQTDEKTREAAILSVKRKLAQEIGAMCGKPILGKENPGNPFYNIVRLQFEKYLNGEELEPIELTIADSNEITEIRDYAAPDGEKDNISEKLSYEKSNVISSMMTGGLLLVRSRIIKKQEFLERFDNRGTLWKKLIASGWIEEKGGNEAVIRAEEEQFRKGLPGVREDESTRIVAFLKHPQDALRLTDILEKRLGENDIAPFEKSFIQSVLLMFYVNTDTLDENVEEGEREEIIDQLDQELRNRLEQDISPEEKALISVGLMLAYKDFNKMKRNGYKDAIVRRNREEKISSLEKTILEFGLMVLNRDKASMDSLKRRRDSLDASPIEKAFSNMGFMLFYNDPDMMSPGHKELALIQKQKGNIVNSLISGGQLFFDSASEFEQALKHRLKEINEEKIEALPSIREMLFREETLIKVFLFVYYKKAASEVALTDEERLELLEQSANKIEYQLARRREAKNVLPFERSMINTGYLLGFKTPFYVRPLIERSHERDCSAFEKTMINTALLLFSEDTKKIKPLEERLKGKNVTKEEKALIKTGLALFYDDKHVLEWPDDSIVDNIEKTNELIELAGKVGVEIAAPVSHYTLFVMQDLFKGEEYETDIRKIDGRFGLKRIMTDRSPWIINCVKKQITMERNENGLDPRNVIVQLPSEFANEYKNDVKRLTDAFDGIKVMIIGTKGLKGAEGAYKYRRNIYSMMLLARRADGETSKASGLYRLLSFFVEKHLKDIEKLEAYLDALIKNDVSAMIQTVLSWESARPVEAPNPDVISGPFMSA